MRFAIGLLLSILVSACAEYSDAQLSSIAGQWDVTASFANGSSAASMTLIETGGVIKGTSGPLDENRCSSLTLKGALSRGVAERLLQRAEQVADLDRDKADG